jgi:hypothetical protein
MLASNGIIERLLPERTPPMSTLGPEARIAAQEALTTLLAARIEELAQNLANDFKDIIARFKANADYQIEIERQMEARFDKLEATQCEHFDKVEASIAELKATQDRHELLLQEILARLPAKPPENISH